MILSKHFSHVLPSNLFGRCEYLIDDRLYVFLRGIDLRAGRKATATAAYSSALKYFSTGMALLDERDWSAASCRDPSRSP
jgi:hypothetical protein